jgi:hypothetical protein
MLLPGLDAIINSSQAAFVPHRSIAENILPAQELVRDYSTEVGKSGCTIKVYIMKAYDSMNWDFILHCLSCFGAPGKYVEWVKECISHSRLKWPLMGL